MSVARLETSSWDSRQIQHLADQSRQLSKLRDTKPTYLVQELI